LEPKVLYDAYVSVESKNIYVSNGNWTVKGRELIALDVDGPNMRIETEKVTITLEECTDDGRLWERFSFKCQKLYAKYHQDEKQGASDRRLKPSLPSKTTSTKRTRRVFGRCANTTVQPRSSFVFDQKIDFEPSDSDRETEPMGVEKMPPLLTKAPEKPETGDDDWSSLVGEELEDEPPAAPEVVRTATATKKGGRLQKIAASSIKHRPTDEDTDDESLFNDQDMTTPAAQRVVSPMTHTAAKGVLYDDDIEVEVSPDKHAILSEAAGKGQRPISSFLKPKSKEFRTSFDPRQNVFGTPQRPAHFKSEMSARLVKSTLRHKKRSLTPKRPLTSQDIWLRSSPTRFSSEEKRKRELFGRERWSDGRKDSTEEVASPSTTPIRSRERQFKRARYVFNKRVKRDLQAPFEGSPVPPCNLEKNWGVDELIEPEESGKNLYRGLQNMGNTCYVNASLQMLTTCRDLTMNLKGKEGKLTRSVVEAAKALADNEEKTPFVPRGVKEAMDEKTDKFLGYEQRDAHEFLNDLVDYIHEELEEEEKKKPGDVNEGAKEETKKRLPTDVFCMTVRVCLKCNSCGYTRYAQSVRFQPDSTRTFRSLPNLSFVSIQMQGRDVSSSFYRYCQGNRSPRRQTGG
jgi:hypothetical protein